MAGHPPVHHRPAGPVGEDPVPGRDGGLDPVPGAGARRSPLAFVGHQMVSMAAWVADQEREVGRRRTKEGLAAARARGQTLGRRRSLTDEQVQLARRMQDAGASGRKIAQLLEVNEKTVRNALKAGP